ncbi:MAG: hypothetical protein C5B49_14420 [Bdellovibrio sp.]|nr:MAG: hypothetical protein C5B49_14420 [Bdellovibrio sp.]
MNGALGWQSFIAIGLLSAAVIDDLRSRKVHNSLVLVSFSIALVSALVSAFLTPQTEVVTPFLSFLAAMALGLPLYAFRVIGGGDYKLMMAVSPLLLPASLPQFFFASLAWGALLGLVLAVQEGQTGGSAAGSTFRNIGQILMLHRPDPSSLRKIPFTVGIFFGYLSLLRGGG